MTGSLPKQAFKIQGVKKPTEAGLNESTLRAVHEHFYRTNG